MSDRFFVEAPIDGARASLIGHEAHHLAHVMRAKPGDSVTLFDGSGAQFEARVESVGRSEVVLEVLAREAVTRELPLCVTLGVALPKGDRQRWLVEKATELGVARLVPLVSERAGEHQSEASLGRLRRAVVEACKQCGRNRLMEVAPQQTLPLFLGDQRPDALRWFAQPDGAAIGELLRELPSELPSSVAIAIGPEGGFTAAEVAAAVNCGWQSVGLGKRILRIETAALAVVAALVAHLEAG
ncbi:MAG: 16S rRNA (uracil(1498)-N(3))-methyltransferase [Pirellulales bacterium]